MLSPAWDWAKWEDAGGPKSNGWLLCSHPVSFNTDIWYIWIKYPRNCWGYFCPLSLISSVMCLDLISVFPSYKTGWYVFKKRERENKRRKKKHWFAWKTCKERGIFSHWQILSSCVSNETEANKSLVYFFVCPLTLLMSAKKFSLFFGEGPVFLFHLAQEWWLLSAIPSKIIKYV